MRKRVEKTVRKIVKLIKKEGLMWNEVESIPRALGIELNSQREQASFQVFGKAKKRGRK